MYLRVCDDAAGPNAFLEGCEELHVAQESWGFIVEGKFCVVLDDCLDLTQEYVKDELNACAIGAADCAPCAAQALHPSPEAEGAADPSALAAVAIFEPTVSAEAGTVSGAVTIYPSPDDSAAVRVSVELEGLPRGDTFYHVHILPVAPGEGLAATLGHWNPLDSPNMGDACNPQDDAEDCEAGDLSGKHGALAGPAACTTYDDYGIALSGVRSVVGRSIVVHNSEGTRVAGATLEAVGPAGDCDCVAP
jgi:Cu/Zn superoxide dismutase